MPAAKKVKLDPPSAPLVGRSKALPLSSGMLKIVVGRDDDKREFHVHEALLTARSKFFASAMRKGWKEAEEKIVRLPDDEHEVFGLYVSLIYNGTVPAFDEQANRIVPKDPRQSSCDDSEKCEIEYELLAQLYVLAEKLQDIRARNTTVDALIAKVRHESQVVNKEEGPCMPGVYSIQKMYEGTSDHCPGRQVMIDCFVWYGQETTLKDIFRRSGDRYLPRQFLMGLAEKLMCHRAHPRHDLPEGKSYHEDDGRKKEMMMRRENGE